MADEGCSDFSCSVALFCYIIIILLRLLCLSDCSIHRRPSFHKNCAQVTSPVSMKVPLSAVRAHLVRILRMYWVGRRS
jgi:hypothetical protein